MEMNESLRLIHLENNHFDFYEIYNEDFIMKFLLIFFCNLFIYLKGNDEKWDEGEPWVDTPMENNHFDYNEIYNGLYPEKESQEYAYAQQNNGITNNNML